MPFGYTASGKICTRGTTWPSLLEPTRSRGRRYGLDDAAPLAQGAWDDALTQDGWQDDDPLADAFVEDLAYARHVFIAHWLAGYHTALLAAAEQHRAEDA